MEWMTHDDPLSRHPGLWISAGRQSYGPRDCILYALGTGFGRDPLDPELLRYVYEKELRVSPTLASVLGENTDWSHDPGWG